MLKVSMKKGIVDDFQIEGNVADICSDVLLTIRIVKDLLEEKNENDAKFFKDIMMEDVEKAFYTTDELENEVAEKHKAIDELLNELGKFLEDK